MFEMLLTVIVTVAAFIYGISNSVLVHSPYRAYYWAVIIIILIIIVIVTTIRRILRKKHLNRLHVDEYEYVYYHKYNSPLYRAGYFISYLIQSILFDYNYMKRNFNFCKGLNTYDDGVSEYYIKFRNTWYRYLYLLFLKHRLSMHKLKAFSCSMKNRMISDQFDSQEIKDQYRLFEANVEKYVSEHHHMNQSLILQIEGNGSIDKYYRKNLATYWKYSLKADRITPKINLLVDTQACHGKQDVDDFKKSRLR